MIRYILDETIAVLAAAQCLHPKLARLRGRGPWKASDLHGSVILQRGEAEHWGEIKNGLGGLRYQLADPLPPLMQAITRNELGNIALVDLPGGVRLPIKLAAYAPVGISLDGTPTGPCDTYGQLAARLWDRMKDNDLPVTDPDLLAFVRAALMSKTNLTEELCHAYDLITSETVPLIFDAANGLPKAAAGGGS